MLGTLGGGLGSAFVGWGRGFAAGAADFAGLGGGIPPLLLSLFTSSKGLSKSSSSKGFSTSNGFSGSEGVCGDGFEGVFLGGLLGGIAGGGASPLSGCGGGGAWRWCGAGAGAVAGGADEIAVASGVQFVSLKGSNAFAMMENIV